jgi:histidinol dehydrogenase
MLKMKILSYPNPTEIAAVLARPSDEQAAERRAKVAAMLAAIRAEGDVAVRRFAQQFDGFSAETFEVAEVEFAAAEHSVSPELQAAIRQAYANILAFHESQKEETRRVETMPGVVCWRKSVAIEKVGLYIPGGTAPLFSTVLMLGVPAQIADCRETVLCTPPRPDGSVHPAILFAAGLCGIRRVFKIGGVQAYGAMAYGTEQVPRVWKIFGPGNSWVTAAKQLVSLEDVAIDLPAGPSEVCVVADSAADPRFVAADLLSQAEHGADSQVLLISTSERLMQAIENELEKQLGDLPRRVFAEQSLENSTAILVNDLDEAMTIMNSYAPEHLILQVAEPELWAEKVVNAGSVFLGPYTPESAGDYASGTNHTLPTSGWARVCSGVSLDSFLKKTTFQHITEDGLRGLGPTIAEMARAEGLEAHHERWTYD